MTKEVPVSGGKYIAIVDDCDYERAMTYAWKLSRDGYVIREKKVSGRRTTMIFHRFILDVPPGIAIDHVNGNRLDNRRSNLRPATNSENMMNSRKPRSAKATSQYKGVSWIASERKWKAAIVLAGKYKNLGRFSNEEDAARAYDAAARDLFGMFARTNFRE